jgi:hypothetical protein
MELNTTEITATFTRLLGETKIGSKGIDVTKLHELIKTYIARLNIENQDIVKLVLNESLVKNVIVPNIEKIFADNQIKLDDIPYFINIITGLFQEVSQFEFKNLTISSSTLVQFVGGVIKVITNLFAPAQYYGMINSIVDSAVIMVNLSVKCSKSVKLCCCK